MPFLLVLFVLLGFDFLVGKISFISQRTLNLKRQKTKLVYQ